MFEVSAKECCSQAASTTRKSASAAPLETGRTPMSSIRIKSARISFETVSSASEEPAATVFEPSIARPGLV